jgi:hypothetical protein
VLIGPVEGERRAVDAATTYLAGAGDHLAVAHRRPVLRPGRSTPSTRLSRSSRGRAGSASAQPTSSATPWWTTSLDVSFKDVLQEHDGQRAEMGY